MIKKTSMLRNKKLFLVIAFLAILFFSTSNIHMLNAAEMKNQSEKSIGIIDIDEKESLYKFSENDDIYLPFLRLSYDKVVIDKEVSNLGITYGNKGIDIDSRTENIQVLFSNDTIRVNNNMEYAVIATSGNVIIDSDISKTIVIFAGEKVTVSENAKILGDIICFSNSLEIKGNVLGSVVGSATNTNISGKIEKDLRLSTENIDIADNNINGDIFIETKNSEITLNDKYPEAQIKLLYEESTKTKVIDMIIRTLKTALVYTLLYLLIFKISKEKLVANMFSVIEKNIGFSIISGAVSILAIPLVIMLTFLGILIGIEEIVIPISIFYIAVVISLALISIFVTGTMIHEYIMSNYISDTDMTKRLVCIFFIFLSMILLTNIPKIGAYINMLYMILGIGIVICYIFKREKYIKSKKKK
ncbi:MAG: hypothetical protein Q4D02_04665 [Clostridia bacterium]|nr:hypothetical protein [Clostridia bacterium]